MDNLKEKSIPINNDFNTKKTYINENILPMYGEKAAIEAITPIYFSDAKILMPIEIDMCVEIFKIWELEKYNVDLGELLDQTILKERDKFICKMLTGKILRLIPAGATIISIGINASLARRFTLALGYAMSELCYSYIQLNKSGVSMDIKSIFSKEAIENIMDSYLIEYNKTVLN